MFVNCYHHPPINYKHFAKLQNKTKKELSTIVAEILAKKAQEKNITKIYFDRGIYKYHGRVKLFDETLRKNGMEFKKWKKILNLMKN